MFRFVLPFISLIVLFVLFPSIANGWTITTGFDGDAGDEDWYQSKISSDYSFSEPNAAKFFIEQGVESVGIHEYQLGSSLYEGDELWVRVYLYVPLGFDWESYPITKLLRVIHAYSDGTMHSYHSILVTKPDNYGCEGVADFGYMVTGSEMNANNLCQNRNVDSTVYLTPGKWHSLELYLKVSATNGILRAWHNGILKQEYSDPTIMPGGFLPQDITTDWGAHHLLGWWNGGATQDQHIYFDDMVVTNETPSNQDVEGNYMIGEVSTNNVFEDGFESADMASDNANGFVWGNNNRTSIVTMKECFSEPIGPNVVWNNGSVCISASDQSKDWTAYSGDNALRFRYPVGEEMAEQRFELGSFYEDLWIQYWIRVPSNFTQGDLNSKFLAIWVGDSGYDVYGDVTWQTRPDDSNGAVLVYSDGGVLSSEDDSTAFIAVPDDRGQWMQILAHVKSASGEFANDGVIQLYRRWDGENVWETIHEKLTANTWRKYAGAQGISHGYLMGWANDSYDVETEWLIDDFKISKTDPRLLSQLIVRADVNRDYKINTIDAMLTLRNSLGLDMAVTVWRTSATTGNVNCDEDSNSTDAMLLLRYSLDLDMTGTNWCE